MPDRAVIIKRLNKGRRLRHSYPTFPASGWMICPVCRTFETLCRRFRPVCRTIGTLCRNIGNDCLAFRQTCQIFGTLCRTFGTLERNIQRICSVIEQTCRMFRKAVFPLTTIFPTFSNLAKKTNTLLDIRQIYGKKLKYFRIRTPTFLLLTYEK